MLCSYIDTGDIPLDDEEIAAAIPLIPAAFSGEYEQATFELIDTALQKRFLRSAVILVFLASIHSTIVNIDGDKFGLRTEGLRRMARWVSASAALPLGLSMLNTGSPRRSGPLNPPLPLPFVIQQSFRNVRESSSPLLQYPVGGFVVIMLISNNFDFPRELRIVAVWHRFSLHLGEKHWALIEMDQARPVAGLEAILHSGNPDLLELPEDPSNAPTDS